MADDQQEKVFRGWIRHISETPVGLLSDYNQLADSAQMQYSSSSLSAHDLKLNDLESSRPSASQWQTWLETLGLDAYSTAPIIREIIMENDG